MKRTVSPEVKVAFYSFFLTQYVARSATYKNFMEEINALEVEYGSHVVADVIFFSEESTYEHLQPNIHKRIKDLSKRFDVFMESKQVAVNFITVISNNELLDLLFEYYSTGKCSVLSDDIDREHKHIDIIDDNIDKGGADLLPYEATIKVSVPSQNTIKSAIFEFADFLYTVFESPHFESFDNNDFYKDWARYTSHSVPSVDYRQRGLGLWMYDYCKSNDCGIYTARNALIASGWLEKFGLGDTHERTIDRWGSGTLSCINEAKFLSLT